MAETGRRTGFRIQVARRRATPRPALRFLAWLVPFAAGFVALWVGSYVLVEALDLRFCQPFRQEHMHKVRFFQTEMTGVDVVYLGTSQVHFGVMPPIVAEEVKTWGAEPGRQYNLAVPGAELELSWILARDVLKGNRLPRRVVLGVTPIVVAAGEDGNPTYVQQYGDLADVAGRVWDGTLPPTALAASSFRGMEVLLQYPFAMARKPMVPFRAEHLRVSEGGWFRPEDEGGSRPLSSADWRRHFDRLGKPKPLYFADDSRPARILRSLRDWSMANHVELTVVYPPQCPGLTDRKWGVGTEERYRDWIEAFCAREELRYLDLSAPEHFGADDFLDTMHLNACGAAKFSRLLARNLPW